MKRTQFLAALALSIAMSSSLFAHTVVKSFRASELTPEVWNQHDKTQEMLVEFRKGDRLPVTLQSAGDLFESSEIHPSYVIVQRDFWVKMKQQDLQLSLDGTHFEPFKKLVEGTLVLGAGSENPGGVANSINIWVKTALK